MDLFKKTKKLSHKHLTELAVLCCTTALLLVAAAFVAGGGMARVSTLLALNHIFPGSQTAGLVEIDVNLAVSPTTVAAGSQAIISWSSYQADDCWIYSFNRPAGVIPQWPGYPYSQTGFHAGPAGQHGTGALSQGATAQTYYYTMECQNVGPSNTGQNACGANTGTCPPASPSVGTGITFLPYYAPYFNNFYPSANSVASGQSTNLNWSVTPSNGGTTYGLYMYGGQYSSGTAMSSWTNYITSGPLYSGTTFQMSVCDYTYGCNRRRRLRSR